VNVKRFEWASLVVVVAGVAACGGGMVSVRATDGSVTRDMAAAVRASAAHDLGCGAEAIDVKDVSVNATYEFVAAGCGSRSTYRVPVHSIYETADVVQMSRSPAVQPAP